MNLKLSTNKPETQKEGKSMDARPGVPKASNSGFLPFYLTATKGCLNTCWNHSANKECKYVWNLGLLTPEPLLHFSTVR
jgi:hypothetical protein